MCDRPDTVQEAFAGIIDLLAAKTPHDFSLYKQGTLQRRIERRMAMAGIESGARYLQVLREDSGERELLAKDLLINVTHFFRDPAAFDLLAETVIPELVQRQTLDRPLRIWVPGCSTGEEAYSIAMLFLEQIAAAKRNIKLQVFASDIDADCVAFARNGIYPESIEADVTPTRLARFFTKEDHSYQVVRELRETVVFTGQSLLADAPFSRLDLISCRNLLIYLSPEAQRKILSLFHFALREGGVLFLGSSETVGNVSDRFEPISKKHRIYRHIGRSRPGEVEFPRGTSDCWPFARQGHGAANGAPTARLRRAIAASVARSLCAGLRPDQRQARGPLLLRVGGPLSEGCLRRGHPGCACHGARGVARQAEIGNPARQTGSMRASPSRGRKSSAMDARSA